MMPVRELVVACDVGIAGGVVLLDEDVGDEESLEARSELLDVLIHLVEAGGVVDELELVGAEGDGDGSEGSESEGFLL